MERTELFFFFPIIFAVIPFQSPNISILYIFSFDISVNSQDDNDNRRYKPAKLQDDKTKNGHDNSCSLPFIIQFVEGLLIRESLFVITFCLKPLKYLTERFF